MKHIILIFSLLSAAAVVSAQSTRYIADESKFPIRSGKSTEHRIVHMASSGTAVTVLENTSDGYSRIRVESGVEGWIMSRFLMDAPAARDQLIKARQENESLRAEGEVFRNKLHGLSSTNAQLEKQRRSLQDQNKDLLEKLASLRHSAARPIQISEQNQQLRQQLDRERETAHELRDNNDLLRQATKRNWFLTGAGVAFGGLLLGLVIPRIPWRKRRSWDAL
ncbi:MAG: TIGR04211 family SH3 domain-containing protein [Pseudomonadota bacterium]